MSHIKNLLYAEENVVNKQENFIRDKLYLSRKTQFFNDVGYLTWRIFSKDRLPKCVYIFDVTQKYVDVLKKHVLQRMKCISN